MLLSRCDAQPSVLWQNKGRECVGVSSLLIIQRFSRCKHETAQGGIIETGETLAGVQRRLCKVNQICSGVCDQFIFPVPQSLC